MYTNLVFSGGGVAGASFAGAVRALDKKGLIRDIKRVAGSSAGALTALALAAGHTSGSLDRFVRSTRYSDLKDGGWFLARFSRLFRKYGMYRGKMLDNLIIDILEQAGLPRDITFRQLEQCRIKRLVVPATNISTRSLEYFSALSSPHMPVAKAVRMSANVPFLFPPVKHEGMLYGDAGMLNNYPISVFDRESAPGENTLGLYIVSGGESGPRRTINGLTSYSREVVKLVQARAGKAHVDDSDWEERTIAIKVGQISPLDFNVTERDIRHLIQYGRQAVNQSPLVI